MSDRRAGRLLVPVLCLLSALVLPAMPASGQSLIDLLKPKPAAEAGVPSGKYPVVKVIRPADVLVTGSSMSIVSGTGVTFPALHTLQLALEQGLQSEFKINPGPKPDLQLAFTVSAYEPVRIGTTVQQEPRMVKVGQHACKVFGKQTMCDDLGMRNVPIQYFEASGMISVQTKVTDAKGVVVGVFSPTDPKQTKIAVKRVISENGQSTLGNEALPTADALLTDLTRRIGALITQAYVQTVQLVEITSLSGDRPLKTGNDLAKSGRWKEALESWRTAKTNDPADQAYNVAVAYEALAYEAYERTRQPDDPEVEGLFTSAFNSYDRALQLKPRDGDFLKAQGRVRESKANFVRAREQYSRQQKDIEIAQADANHRRDEEAKLRETRPDTRDEADFRSVVRLRLESQAASAAPDAAQLETLGKAYKLSSDAIKRVVFQETERAHNLDANLALYKEQFGVLAADGRIDAADDKALASLAQRLDLSAKNITSVESQFPAGLRVAKPVARPQTSNPPKAAGTPPAQAPASAPVTQKPSPTTPKPAPAAPTPAAPPTIRP